MGTEARARALGPRHLPAVCCWPLQVPPTDPWRPESQGSACANLPSSLGLLPGGTIASGRGLWPSGRVPTYEPGGPSSIPGQGA